MKGLLRSLFYSAADNLRVAMVLVAAAGVVLVASGSTTLLNVLPLVVPPLLALVAIGALRREGASKWPRYQLTLPVRRRDIVRSRYLSHLFWSLAGTLAAALLLAMTLAVHGDHYFYYGLRDALTLVLGGGVLALLIGAIAYPLLQRLGTERLEAVFAVSVAGAVALVLGMSLVINLVAAGDVNDSLYYGSLVAIVGLTALLYIASYNFTALCFTRQDG